MEYKYAKNCNYEDFASGRVLYHVNGAPNFPVRLANEIYGRCLEHSVKKKDICLYDCCCGGAYSVTVLGLLNQESISRIIASDIDYRVLETARANLSLLSRSGIERRIEEIRSMRERFNKSSHRDAEESALRLLSLIQKEIDARLFQANALREIHMDVEPDIIITDVPYGNLAVWQGETDGVNSLLESMGKLCGSETVVAICTDKNQRINSANFRRLEKHGIGKRKFEIYKPG